MLTRVLVFACFRRCFARCVASSGLMLDRHASSTLSLDEIAALVDDLIEAHGDALPEGLRASGTRTAR